MVGFGYLQQGVTGLANSWRAGTMAGHLGAAVAAGYFFGEDAGPPVSEGVTAGVEAELDRVMAGEEAIWFNAAKAGVTPAGLFADSGDGGPPVRNGADAIVAALAEGEGRLRQSGHDVIFGSIAARALKDHPQVATAATVEGLVKLMRAFGGQSEGRGFYGKSEGWKNGQDITLPNDPALPPYEDFAALARTTIGELIATAAVRKQGFGGLFHVINHAAAILELARYGYRDVAAEALPAHHRHIRLWRTLPDLEAELGPVVRATASPWTDGYWRGELKRDGARLTHRIKTLYGYQVVRSMVDGPLRARGDDAILWLMD